MAASDFNSVIISGRLTRDSESKTVGNSHTLTTFSMAVNHQVKENDTWVSKAEYFDFELFDKPGLADYLKKGSKFFVMGSLHQNTWKDNEGKNHSRVTIKVNQIQFGSEKTNAPTGEPINVSGNGVQQATAGFEEDIPF